MIRPCTVMPMTGPGCVKLQEMLDGARAILSCRVVCGAGIGSFVFPSPRIPFAIRKLPVMFLVFSWWRGSNSAKPWQCIGSYPRSAAEQSSRAA